MKHPLFLPAAPVALGVGFATPAAAQSTGGGADFFLSLLPLILLAGLVAAAVLLAKRRNKSVAAASDGPVADRLAQIHELHEAGALTDLEFDRQKQIILGSAQR